MMVININRQRRLQPFLHPPDVLIEALFGSPCKKLLINAVNVREGPVMRALGGGERCIASREILHPRLAFNSGGERKYITYLPLDNEDEENERKLHRHRWRRGGIK
jgi:hypothetical protein